MIDFAIAFAALGHPSRLAIFRMLARRAPDMAPAGEIAAAVNVRPNTLSVHLATLSRAALIEGRRDGKNILYRIDMARAGALIDYLALDCCRARPEVCAPLTALTLSRNKNRETPAMTQNRVFNVLFVCTGNSARSIFAEAIMNRDGGDKFRAFSAGTRENSELNPLAMERLQALGFDTSALRSKNVAEFRTPDAPKMDFVFTVCDRAANEECPPWPGQPISGHWGIPDPVKVEGTEAEKKLAFAEAFRMLRHRVTAFANLPVERLGAIALQRAIDAIGADADKAEAEAETETETEAKKAEA